MAQKNQKPILQITHAEDVLPILTQPKGKVERFDAGQQVKIVKGPLRGQNGTVHECRGRSVVIELANGTRVNTSVSSVRAAR